MKHPEFFPASFLRTLLPALLVLALLAGCGEGSTTAPEEVERTRVGVVVNSVERTLTVFDLEAPQEIRTIPLGPDGSPVGAAIRGNLAVVPMGIVPVAVVVDLAQGMVLRSVALPEGSGATGVAFVNDSVALVANPGRDSVSPVNVLRGTAAGEIAVGGFPSGVEVVDGRVVVVNAELEDFQPARDGTLTILDRETLAVAGTVELSGRNPGPVVRGSGGLLYVVNGGVWGEGNGSLSVVDLAEEREVARHDGFGNLPGSAALAGDGQLYVASWSYGVAVWDPASASFQRGPGNAIEPEGIGASAGVATDPEGRLYTLFPECDDSSRVLRLSPSYSVELSVEVGICPAALYFAELEGEEGV